MASNKKRIEVDIIANDKASSVYDRIARGTRNMSNDINGSITSLNKILRNYNNAMSAFNRGTQVAMAAAGYFTYKFTTDSVKQFAEFEKQHGKTMGAMANNYEKTAKAQKKFFEDQFKYKQDALRLGTAGPDGRGSFFNPTQVAYSQTSLVKAGVSPTVKSTTDILRFAGGNDISIDTATDYAVNVAKQFGIKQENWGNMLDKITRAADISTIDVPDVFETLKYAGGIASGLDRPLEEVLAMTAIMGNAGLKGSMSGTGIQSFFTKILSPIGKTDQSLQTAPTEFARQALESFVASVTDASGSFKDASVVTEDLDKVMDELNDREQAWFAHKLFGLFQMKSAYALRNSGGSGLQNVMDDIINNSAGTNENKWDLMLETSYGKMTALSNMWTGTKTDVGYRLAPITNAIADEMFNVLSNKGNYDIDFDSLREAINKSGDMIAEQYGLQIGSFVKSGGNNIVSGSRALAANIPLAEGVAASLMKILSGDIKGGIGEMGTAIQRANENINQLPPELQGLAKQVRNAALALTALISINFATRLAETLTTLWRYSIGQLITARNMNVKAATVVVAGSGILDKNGVPFGGTGTGGSVILDKNGNPIQKTATKPTAGSRISTGINAASWIYSIGEMTGLNDMILDKLGITGDARGAVDTGRTILNYGMIAKFMDSMVLKGAGTQLVKKAATGLVSGITGALPSIASELGMSVAGAAGALTLPLAAGTFMIGSEIQKSKVAKDTQEKIDKAEAEDRPWYWANNKNPWWNPNGLFDNRDRVITGRTKEEQKQWSEDMKYQYPTTISQGAPMKQWWEHIPFLSGGYNNRYNEWKKNNDELRAKQEYERTLYNSARALSNKRTGSMITYDEFKSNIDKWKNDPDITSDGSVKFDALFGMSKETMDKSLNSFTIMEKALNTVAGLQKPTVNVNPKVDVHVTLDNNGNILDQKTYIGDFGLIDKAFGVFESRNGK